MKGIAGQQWQDLIDYVYLRCDAMTFQVPNYSIHIYNHNNGICEPQDYKREIVDNMINKHKQYINNINPILNNLKEDFIDVTAGNEYLGEIYEFEVMQYIVRLSPNAYSVLKQSASLYYWDYPHMTIGLNFYSKGKVWLYSTAMDQLYGIMYIQKKKEIV